MITSGILLIDKPKGWTSFDVVNRTRRLCQQAGFNTTGRKRYLVGHTGTLDPLATGLLVILVGTYTKKAPNLTKLDKTYEVTMNLGVTSSTGDEEGEKTNVSDTQPAESIVNDVLNSFVGDTMQTPPKFSAIKINGQRAYKLARKGLEVELEPRPVHIDSISNFRYVYPEVKFTVHVSSGTYIRSLVEDIGKKLGTGAYMTDLRRTKVGDFDISNSVGIEDVSAEILSDRLVLVD